MYFKPSVSILLCGLCIILACTSKKSSEVYKSSEDDITGGFKGNIKWSPDTISQVPEGAPFDISLEYDQKSDSNKVLELKLIIHNTSDSLLYLSAIAGERPYYDFVVTSLDSMRVWNRIQTNIRVTVQALIELDADERKYFEDSWDYENYDGEKLEKGKYLIFGFIENLSLWDKNYQKEIYEYVDIGVKADTLVFE